MKKSLGGKICAFAVTFLRPICKIGSYEYLPKGVSNCLKGQNNYNALKLIQRKFNKK